MHIITIDEGGLNRDCWSDAVEMSPGKQSLFFSDSSIISSLRLDFRLIVCSIDN